MAGKSKPPRIYESFIEHYPKLGEAWEKIAEAGNQGPLSEENIRLIKLAIAVGAMRQGAVHSSVRKALDIGVEVAKIDQVVSLAAGTLGLPSTVAVFSWVRDVTESRQGVAK